MPRIAQYQTRFARRLRSEMTDSERLLWRHLRLRQFNGFKFRRQYLIDKYFVDFVCVESALAIEIDGGHHSEQNEADEIRSAELRGFGYFVMRFWDNDVLQQIANVKAAIWCQLQASHPHPNLPPKRGKEYPFASSLHDEGTS